MNVILLSWIRMFNAMAYLSSWIINMLIMSSKGHLSNKYHRPPILGQNIVLGVFAPNCARSSAILFEPIAGTNLHHIYIDTWHSGWNQLHSQNLPYSIQWAAKEAQLSSTTFWWCFVSRFNDLFFIKDVDVINCDKKYIKKTCSLQSAPIRWHNQRGMLQNDVTWHVQWMDVQAGHFANIICLFEIFLIYCCYWFDVHVC